MKNEKIKKYLKGMMSEDDLLEFEKQIKSDKELKNRVEEERTGLTFDRLERYLYLTKQIESYQKMTKFKWIMKLAIAASIILLGLIGSYVHISSNYTYQVIAKKLFEKPYNISSNLMGVNKNSSEKVIDEALEFYKKKDFENVIKKLHTTSNDAYNYELIQFLLGNSYLASDKPLLALEAFQNVTKTSDQDNPNPLRHAVKWYEGLAHLANGNINEAEFIFIDISKNSKSTFYKEKAEIALRKMNSIPFKIAN